MFAACLALALVAQDELLDTALTERASQRLLDAEQTLVDELPRMRPGEALPGTRAALLASISGLDGTAMGDWTDALAEAQVALLELDSAWLAPDRRLDALTLEAWVLRERQVLAMHKPRFRDPLFYLEAIEGSLRTLVPEDIETIRSAQLEALIGRLEEIPRILTEARDRLEAVPVLWAEEGSYACTGLLLYLAREGSELAQVEFISEQQRARCEAASSSAAQAVGEFGTWLRQDIVGSARHPSSLPDRSFASLCTRTYGDEIDVEQLKLLLLIAISERSAAVGEYLNRVPGDAPLDLAETRRQAQAYFDFVAQAARELPGYPTAQVDFSLSVQPSLALASPATRPYRRALDHWVLELEFPDPSWPAAALPARAALFGPEGLELLALRDGMAGAALLRSVAASSLSLTRARIPNGLRERAFGMYVARRAGVLGLAPEGAEGLNGELARTELWEAARALIALEIHALHMDPFSAVQRFTTFTGSDELTARMEIARALRDPLYGGAFYVLDQTLRLEQRLAARSAPGEDSAALESPGLGQRERALLTIQTLLRNPSARVADL